jgi:hypothetical protein
MHRMIALGALVVLGMAGARPAEAQIGSGLRLHFDVEPLTRAVPARPRARVPLAEWPDTHFPVAPLRSFPAAPPARVCPMPVGRDSVARDSMPVARRDSAFVQRMPVAPGDCRRAAP